MKRDGEREGERERWGERNRNKLFDPTWKKNKHNNRKFETEKKKFQRQNVVMFLLKVKY